MKSGLMKWIAYSISLALAVTAAVGLLWLGGESEQKKMEPVDGMVYSFIVGKVEGNDDLLAEVLMPEAQGIIKPGRHAYPGAAEEMGDRYSITRYAGGYEEGVLIYEVSFYRPSTGKINHYNVLVLNTDVGWRVAKNSTVDEWMVASFKQTEKGTEVHTYEGEGQS